MMEDFSRCDRSDFTRCDCIKDLIEKNFPAVPSGWSQAWNILFSLLMTSRIKAKGKLGFDLFFPLALSFFQAQNSFTWFVLLDISRTKGKHFKSLKRAVQRHHLVPLRCHCHLSEKCFFDSSHFWRFHCKEAGQAYLEQGWGWSSTKHQSIWSQKGPMNVPNIFPWQSS